MRDVCFILGSGRSLLDLTTEERAALSAHPRTVAMNKFLLFHDVVGIRPRLVFLADTNFPAPFVFFESLKIARRLSSRPWFYVNRYYTKLFSWRPRRFLWARRERRRLREEHGFRVPRRLAYRWVVPFFSQSKSSRPFFWAESLAEELYFYRGSLTTAINLANILYPRCDIALVGVDLNSHEAFYERELARYGEVFSRMDAHEAEKQELARRAGRHLTALPYNGRPGVPHVIPTIVEHLERHGVRLVCCHPESLLVTAGLCPYVPLDDCLGASSAAHRAVEQPQQAVSGSGIR